MNFSKLFLGLLLIFLITVGAGTACGACPVAQGDWDYCTLCGPCQPEEGDCDSDSDCASGLNCEHDVGPTYGLAKGVDVCLGIPATGPGTASGQQSSISTSSPSQNVDSEVFGGPTVSGTLTTSSVSPHTTAADCTGLNALLNPACQSSTSSSTGTTTVLAGSSGCAFPVGHPSYCFSCGPCTEGEGGCNRNYQCADGLICDLSSNICVAP